MAIDKKNLPNVNIGDLANYPDGRTQDNDGSGNGTALNNDLLGDKFETFDKLMRLYGIDFNDLPDNETNGYQYVDALIALASKNDYVLDITEDSGDLVIPIKLGMLKDNESFILKATVNKSTETDLKGSLDDVTKPITFVGDFKSGEYVRMINLTSSVILVRLLDVANIKSVLDELDYFSDRAIGTESSNFLATSSRNGLLNKDDYGKISNIIMTGKVNSNGTIAGGTGFTVNRTSEGVYIVTHNIGNTNYIALPMSRDPEENAYCRIVSESTTAFEVRVTELVSTDNRDRDFSFGVFKLF